MAQLQQNNRQSLSENYSCFKVFKMWCWKGFKWLPVLLIVSIVSWSYYAYVIQLCIFTIESTVQQCIYLVLYHILLIMFSWSYWRTLFAEIRPIPDKYRLPDEEMQMLLSAENEEGQRAILENFAKDLPIVTRTVSGTVSYCNQCALVKPDRSHHCRICSRCVLKMDHHCPWVNNCVCYFNYKFFVLFLGYTSLYCVFFIATCLPFFIKFMKKVLEPYNFVTSFPLHWEKMCRYPAARTMSGAVRYCNRCALVKPDRAHHCSICSRCVLKMDHHCPWVNNCVCYFNYKFFMLFLGYALVYCIFIIATCLPFFIKFWKGEFGTGLPAARYHIMFAFFVALMFGISLASLFGYHCYLLANNRTTLDELSRHGHKRSTTGLVIRSILDSITDEAFRAPMFRGGADKNGFSMGAFKNFKEVFGNSPKLWMVPVFTSLGDGCEFPVRPEHRLQTFTTQPDLNYESMGTTRPSFGDGIVYPLPHQEEDTESLLSSERWDRWGERSRPFDERESSSLDEL